MNEAELEFIKEAKRIIAEYELLQELKNIVNNANFDPEQPRDEYGRWTTATAYFVNGVLHEPEKLKKEKIFDVSVGKLSQKVIDYLLERGIIAKTDDIKLCFKSLTHSLRETKVLKQKPSEEQLKRIDKIIAKDNTYFDEYHQNIFYIDDLPENEIFEDRDIIKVPIKIRDTNVVATVSRINKDDVIKSPKIYKKID